jgi:hypothetical protein
MLTNRMHRSVTWIESEHGTLRRSLANGVVAQRPGSRGLRLSATQLRDRAWTRRLFS